MFHIRDEFVNWLIQDLAQPLGLKCDSGFESKWIVVHINNECGLLKEEI